MLFDNCKNSKAQGNIGLASAIQYFVSKGYGVSIPLNDSQSYDLVIDDGEKLIAVEVKTTKQRLPSDNYLVDLRSSGGTKGDTYSRVSESFCDYLFVLTEMGDKFLIPKSVVPRCSITFSGEWLNYKVE